MGDSLHEENQDICESSYINEVLRFDGKCMNFK